MAHDQPIVIEYVPIDELQPDIANPRRMGEAELEALTRSVQTFSLVDPLIAQRSTGRIIGGHQRGVVARRLGIREVPVVWVDLTDEEARLLGLALNRISGDWDEELLARLLSDLTESSSLDLSLSGFEEEEIAGFLQTLDARERRERPETFDLDQAVDEAFASPARTTLGDLWILGPHRLLCGDSTDGDAVARLMQSQSAAMAFSDPPYNVDLGNHGGQQRGSRRRAIQNDSMPLEQWEGFCRRWSQQFLTHVEGALYICMSSKEWPLVARVLAEEGGHWSDTIIWVKDRFVLGRADYQRQYEPIWYGWLEGGRHQWHGGRDQSDVWTIPRPSTSQLHPTMKPVALVERAIEHSSSRGEVVLDLFLGSGTTLIAAERTGRTCYGTELDPRYVDVAVARWEAFTGEPAHREPAVARVD